MPGEVLLPEEGEELEATDWVIYEHPDAVWAAGLRRANALDSAVPTDEPWNRQLRTHRSE